MATTDTDHLAGNGKVLRLVEYLTALAKIDRKIIRDVDDAGTYKRVVWFHEIPHDPRFCFVQAWGEEDDSAEGSWITVEKCPEPLLPEPPEGCRGWVDHETLKSMDEIPELQRVVVISREETDPESGEVYEIAETRRLEDYPEVSASWEDYIESQWRPWTDRRRRYNAVSNVYSKLFQIYQDQQRLGEQYELLVSFGLLTWLTPTGHTVRRHLVSLAATLEFDPYVGKFTVGPSIEGSHVLVEFDMLDPEYQPENVNQLRDDGTKVLQDNPWDRSAVDPYLNAVCNSLSARGDGTYFGAGIEPINQTASEKPVVEFAPALILRKRSLKGLERVLLQIKKQIGLGNEVPPGFLYLCESTLGEAKEWNEEQTSSGQWTDPEIYFPLPANEEQRKIVEALKRKYGVLVQGPPGTGKSHTIANLICHLLATGQRVLVTAKTPRALKVLHNKLPEEIKPLCINLLGHGTEERQSLEKSVQGILYRMTAFSGVQVQEDIQRLEKQIGEKRKEKTVTDNTLLAIREGEVHKHFVADGTYQGTAAEIAQKLNKDKEEFSWFEDRIPPEQVLPLTEEEISWLRQQLVELDARTEQELKLFLPDPDCDLPAVEKIRKLFKREQAATRHIASASAHLQSSAGRALQRADIQFVETFKSELETLAAEASTLRAKPASWIRRAVDDVLADNAASWRERLNMSKTEAQSLHNLAERLNDHEIEIPAKMDRRKLRRDVEAVREHVEGGGTLGSWFWTPGVVKKHGEFLETVTVDGSKCSDASTLEKLIDYIDLEQRMKHVWKHWQGIVRPPIASFPIQIARIKELNDELEAIVGLHGLKERAIASVTRVNGLNPPRWQEANDLQEHVETCRTVQIRRALVSIRRQLQDIENAIGREAAKASTHPIVGELLEAFRRRDSESYGRLCDRTKELRRQAESTRRKGAMVERLALAAPKLSSALSQGCEARQWADRLKNLTKAWAWARAKTWLDEYLATDHQSLEFYSAQLDEEIRGDLTRLAAAKAWRFCLDRMKDHHHGHLVSWQKAMEKVGKGTGKFVHVFRQNAQRHLNECREAVPAWIMPLHRVYETVPADAELFDVIIVDEASQCGPESLPLLYLGKRILIVGDDKQISPEAVGVPKAKVHRLINDFLWDFRFRDAFDAENSLFSHGNTHFGTPITLLEHFRCMPEIIRFSDDLCYSTSRLIPLRQYPPDRLDPVKLTKVSSGYREGKGPRVINHPEAVKLAETVAQCCQDKKYEGLTMGVIVLQGEAQAGVIEDLLLKNIEADQMARHRLVCGNPYSFQGDERDVIFLSMVAGPNERIGTLNKMPDIRRFNVAASRARDQIWLFHSDIYNKLSEDCLRRRLLDHFMNPGRRIDDGLGVKIEELREKASRANRMIDKRPGRFDSWFEVDVALEIANRGYMVDSQFEFAGKRIDLVVNGGQARLAVECYGEHWHSGEENFKADLERQRKLERCGWHFFIVRESFYRAAPEEALKGLWEMLDRMGIYPVSFSEAEGSAVPHDERRRDQYQDEPAREQKLQNKREEEQVETGSEDIPDNCSIAKAPEIGVPTTIQDALRAPREIIGKAIIRILQDRPNNSCKKDKVMAYILKMWGINTRRRPRKRFEKKVDDAIAVMERAGHVEVYTATNVRIKLGWVPYPGLDST